MPSVNLAPGTQYLRQVRRRQRRLLFLAAAIVVVAGAVWGGLELYRRSLESDLGSTAGRLRTVEVEIAKLDDVANRIVLFENRLEVLDGLLDEHISWDEVLASVERLLPADTVIRSMTVRSDRGLLEFQGETASIDSAAVALASLRASEGHQTIFESGTLRGVTRNVSGGPDEEQVVTYVFGGELKFAPGILRSGQ